MWFFTLHTHFLKIFLSDCLLTCFFIGTQKKIKIAEKIKKNNKLDSNNENNSSTNLPPSNKLTYKHR